MNAIVPGTGSLFGVEAGDQLRGGRGDGGGQEEGLD